MRVVLNRSSSSSSSRGPNLDHYGAWIRRSLVGERREPRALSREDDDDDGGRVDGGTQ
jgi:hypothetical protein